MKNSQKTIFTTMTLNILFDTRRKNQNPRFLQKHHIKHSQERFSHIIKKVVQLKPDIITFNEVTSLFIHFLDQNEFISKNYFRSQVDFNPKTNYDVQGNIVLIKRNFQGIRIQKIQLETHDQPVPIVFFSIKNKVIAIASVHLLAFSKNQKKRQSQLQQILDHFNFKSQKPPNLLILQGDMNFHSQSQNKILNQMGLKDCWLEKYDLKQNPGYTFDSYQNKMINELYWGFEQRRMRLDRIFLHQYQLNNKIQIQSINLVLNEPIYKKYIDFDQRFMGFFKGIISFIGDIFGKNLLRKKENYLFPSDHFGIFTTFEIK